MVHTLHKLRRETLTDLKTHDVSGLLLVVAGVGALNDTLHHLVDVSGVDTGLARLNDLADIL